MTKRLFPLILAAVMLLSLVPAAMADETVTLRLWAGIQPEYGYDALVEAFNQEYKDKGIQLEYVRYKNDADGNLQLDTYLMANGEVDVFVGYGGLTRLQPRQEAGLVLDLTDVMKEKGFDLEKELGATNLNSSTIDGRFYAMPTKYENNQWMFINKEMFDAAGVEIPYDGWTYAEFREAAKKLTHGEGLDKVYGMYWNISYDINMHLTFMNNYLGDYSIYKNMECTESNFDDPLYEEGLQLIVDTMLVDKSAPTYGEEKANQMSLTSMFLEGKAAMAMGIASIRTVKDVATYPREFTTVLVPAPVPDESYLEEYWDHGNVSTGIGDTVCVNANSEHIDEALDFMIWYVTGGMTPLAYGGRLPLWSGIDAQGVADSLMRDADGVFDQQSVLNYLAIDKSKINLTPNRKNFASAEITTVAKEELEYAMAGRKTPAQALADIKTRSDELIQNAMGK